LYKSNEYWSGNVQNTYISQFWGGESKFAIGFRLSLSDTEISSIWFRFVLKISILNVQVQRILKWWCPKLHIYLNFEVVNPNLQSDFDYLYQTPRYRRFDFDLYWKFWIYNFLLIISLWFIIIYRLFLYYILLFIF
jgi:hypothetical protein